MPESASAEGELPRFGRCGTFHQRTSEILTRIKICGITNADDANAAIRFGADALGFIGVPDTPRFVSVESARAFLRGLPPFVTPVVVVRNLPDAVPYAALAGAVQYYHLGDIHNASRLPPVRIPAFRVRNDAPVAESVDVYTYSNIAPVAVLLDAFHETALGGTGESWNWERATEAKELLGAVPLILAGGLTPENVFDAVRTVRPYAVDVSSGVEAEPRRKDYDKIRRFIEAVRAADRE